MAENFSSAAGLVEFLKSIWTGWFTRMSGPLGVPLSALGVYYFDQPTPRAFFGATCLVCILATAFGTWKTERQRLVELQGKLDVIANDRSFTYENIALISEAVGLPQLYNLNLSIVFRNCGNAMLRWNLTNLQIEVGGEVINQADEPINMGGFIHAGQPMSYHCVTIPNIVLDHNNLLIVVVSFIAEYDNVPSTKIRTTKRTIRCQIPLGNPAASINQILEQDEY